MIGNSQLGPQSPPISCHLGGRISCHLGSIVPRSPHSGQFPGTVFTRQGGQLSHLGGCFLTSRCGQKISRSLVRFSDQFWHWVSWLIAPIVSLIGWLIPRPINSDTGCPRQWVIGRIVWFIPVCLFHFLTVNQTHFIFMFSKFSFSRFLLAFCIFYL